MKKYYSKISGCILLVALEILMFLWTPYYKGFICTTYIVEHINAGDIIFRLVYYAIYFLSVYTMFSYYCFGKFYSFFMRSPVGLILSFASVRLMADVANYIIYYFYQVINVNSCSNSDKNNCRCYYYFFLFINGF